MSIVKWNDFFFLILFLKQNFISVAGCWLSSAAAAARKSVKVSENEKKMISFPFHSIHLSSKSRSCACLESINTTAISANFFFYLKKLDPQLQQKLSLFGSIKCVCMYVCLDSFTLLNHFITNFRKISIRKKS